MMRYPDFIRAFRNKIARNKFLMGIFRHRIRTDWNMPVDRSVRMNSLWTNRAMAVLWTIEALAVSCAALLHETYASLAPPRPFRQTQHVTPKQHNISKSPSNSHLH